MCYPTEGTESNPCSSFLVPLTFIQTTCVLYFVRFAADLGAAAARNETYPNHKKK
jgi:hypothetical protein